MPLMTSSSGVCVLLRAGLGWDGAAETAATLKSVFRAPTGGVVIPGGRLLLLRDRLQLAARHVGERPQTGGAFISNGAALSSLPCDDKPH